MPANEQPQANGQTTITALQDAIYGTRNYTSGARYQLPRKVPLRIEPKTYFGKVAEHHGVRRLTPVKLTLFNCYACVCKGQTCAWFFPPYTSRQTAVGLTRTVHAANERTLLAWLSMAVTIGSVSAALVGFTASEKDVKGLHPPTHTCW